MVFSVFFSSGTTVCIIRYACGIKTAVELIYIMKEKEVFAYRQEEGKFLKEFEVKEILESLNNKYWHKYGIVNDISRTSSYENSVYYYSGYQLLFGHSDKSPNIIIGAATEITNNSKKSNFLFTKHGLSQSDCLDINFWEKNSPKSIDERIDLDKPERLGETIKTLPQKLENKYADFMKKEIENVRKSLI